jgi:hypothetical protein
VALQAESKYRRPFQQACVRRTMRDMTGLTAIHSQREMLKCEWAPLADVAFQTGFLVNETLVHQLRSRPHPPCGGECSVGVVAVGALHESFVHSMLRRHCELSADIGVTAIAKLRLGFREKQLWSGGFMNRMTTRASDLTRRMGRTANVGAWNLLRVTRQARIQCFL